MTEMMLAGLREMVSLSSVLLMFVGTFVGVVFGAIPGLTGGIAIAILLPMTFYMETIPAMALLIGVYVGGSFGGSIPACLFAIPGSPEAGITVFDGYPMSRQRKSLKAMKTALYASCCGNFLSSIVTIVLIVFISKLALKMGSVEYFAVMLFSIVLIATVGAKNDWIKGLLAAFVGLFFSFVGSDPITGVTRFSFGIPELYSTIQLIPVLIGLFVGAELLANVRTQKSYGEVKAESKEENKITKAEVKACLPWCLTGSAIGSVIGALPGLNAAVSATLNYALLKRIGKNKENLGNGDIRGIAAAESANNGTVGPTLAPLLTLGIPGSGTAAIFLGALMIHGIQVGPTIFKESGDVVYSIFFALLLCTLSLAIVGRFVIGGAKYLSKVPATVLNPIIVLTCCAGVYAQSSRMFDVYVFLFFLFIGYWMSVVKIPVLPLLISFLLGSLMEANFRRSLVLMKRNPTLFADSKVGILFISISVLLILFTALEKPIKHLIEKRGKK